MTPYDVSFTTPLAPSTEAAYGASRPAVRYVSASQVRQMRWLVFIGVVLTGHFLWWFADADHIGYAPLFWLLTVSLGFKMLRMLHEWYHYVQVSKPVPPAGPVPAFTVDVLTTFCAGEPYAMIEQTLRAMQAITYPHTSYLCDESDDAYLRLLCARLGVHTVGAGSR